MHVVIHDGPIEFQDHHMPCLVRLSNNGLAIIHEKCNGSSNRYSITELPSLNAIERVVESPCYLYDGKVTLQNSHLDV